MKQEVADELGIRLTRLLKTVRNIMAEQTNQQHSLQDEALYDDINWLDDFTVGGHINEPNCLTQANDLTSGDRRQAYDHPAVDFRCTAMMWTALLQRTGTMQITTEMVPIFMAALKLSRLVSNVTHADSIVDVAGYMRTLEMVNEYNL